MKTETYDDVILDCTVEVDENNDPVETIYGRRGIQVWAFSFGSYGSTRILVVCDNHQGIEGALEIAAGWLADNRPGEIVEPDYDEAARDAGFESWADAEASDESDDGVLGDIRDNAEADLTYTESGWLVSYDWHVAEVEWDDVKEAILDVAEIEEETCRYYNGSEETRRYLKV